MDVKTFIRSETEPVGDIMSLLQGRVFHVTKHAYLESILMDRAIKPNADGALPTSFGYSSNSFFSHRGYVSLFDYRAEPTEEIELHRNKCRPLMPGQPGDDGVAILILKPEIHSLLVPWTRWKEENALSEMVVPYVEAGHLGPISTDLIDQMFVVKIEEDPMSFTARLRKGRSVAR